MALFKLTDAASNQRSDGKSLVGDDGTSEFAVEDGELFFSNKKQTSQLLYRNHIKKDLNGNIDIRKRRIQSERGWCIPTIEYGDQGQPWHKIEKPAASP